MEMEDFGVNGHGESMAQRQGEGRLSKSRGASGGHERWGQGIETKKQRDAAQSSIFVTADCWGGGLILHLPSPWGIRTGKSRILVPQGATASKHLALGLIRDMIESLGTGNGGILVT